MSKVKEITSCDVCGNRTLVSALNLGSHPLCDDLVPIGSERVCEEYAIEVLFCKVCKTAHQRFQVAKEVLFPAEYHYRARFTKDVMHGLEGLVDSCESRMGDLEGRAVLDVGCNDGCLLDMFKARGAKTLGIEPTNAAWDARVKGHEVIRAYFGSDLPEIKADIITFTNVFAHLEDLQSAIESLRSMCHAKTTIVIENHYLGSVLEKNQFDTFYHEHPRTYSYTSFLYIAKAIRMDVSHVEFPERYGGNIRVFLSRHLGSHPWMGENIALKAFEHLAEQAFQWSTRKGFKIRQLVEEYGPLKAIAFPGRAAILIRLLGLTEEHISGVYQKDGSPKVGHYVPGTRIPILSDAGLKSHAPVLNLAWHLPGEVREHLKSIGCISEVIDVISQEDFECSPSLAAASEPTAISLH